MAFLQRLFGGGSGDNLRIIITRHGERADLAIGKQWASELRKKGGRDPRIPHLTRRADYREWNYDSSLTIEGERQSAHVGRKLLELGYPIDYCYSSPAYRSVQTANKILESQGRKAVPISVEPGRQQSIFSFVSYFSFFFKAYLNVLPGTAENHSHSSLRRR